jgi:hypothetical protein
MVRIISWRSAQNKEGKNFTSIQLQGGIEAMQSQQTGKMYLTARAAWIPSTFDEATAQSLIGSSLPGTINRVSCDPYEYTIKDTGEVIILGYSYEYVPIEVPEEIVEVQPIPANPFATASLAR